MLVGLCVSLQVHGVTNDTVEFVYGIIRTEMNSATDNPVSCFIHLIVGFS